jgi:hypothetical protein
MATKMVLARAALGAILTLVLPGLAAAEPAREPRKMEAEYVITWLGFPVYAVNFAGEWNGERYTLRFRAEPQGLARLGSSTTVEWETKGRLEQGQPQPERFKQANTFRRQLRRITLTYSANGAPAVSVVPPESPGKRPPVPEPLKGGTLDPLSATFAAVARPFDTRTCGYAARVFEGLRRTDVRLEHAGTERTPAHRVPGLDRESLVCRMHADRLAGYPPKDFRQNPDPLPPAILWVAKHAEAGLWLPVQLRFDSAYGPVYARLVKVDSGSGGGR